MVIGGKWTDTVGRIEYYLGDLESRIDDDAETALYQQWVEFTDGKFKGDIFSPRRRSKSAPAVEWPKVNINDALCDYSQMALHQFEACSRQLEAGGGALMAVRCNYGTGILPSLWGAEIFEMPRKMDTLPTTRALPGGKETIRKLLHDGVPDMTKGYGAQVFDMAECYLEIKEAYPQIGKHVHIYHPDIQGPMDVCELLWSSSIFLDICDEPELVKDMLALITETYISFMRRWDSLIPPIGGYAVHWSMLHKGHIMLRDDSAMNFSPQMCDEFIRPYDQRLLDEFGGGTIHFCGRGDHYISSFSEMRGIYSFNMSQPHLNDMEKIYDATVDKGINLIGFDRGHATAALNQGRDFGGRVHCW